MTYLKANSNDLSHPGEHVATCELPNVDVLHEQMVALD